MDFPARFRPMAAALVSCAPSHTRCRFRTPRLATDAARRPRVLGRSIGPEDRTQPTKLAIPFGHAFDSRGVSSPKSVVRACIPSVFDQPSSSAHTRRRLQHEPIGQRPRQLGDGELLLVTQDRAHGIEPGTRPEQMCSTKSSGYTTLSGDTRPSAISARFSSSARWRLA
jgi:hypothetical protein